MIHFEQMDCFNFLPTLPNASVDAIICDLPFGTTQCKWDCRLPLNKLWPELWRVAKPSAPVLMFGSQPFTSVLVMSQLDTFVMSGYGKNQRQVIFLTLKESH